MKINQPKNKLYAEKVNGAYSEPNLVLPTLQLLAANPKGLTTTQLIAALTNALNPAGRDSQIIQNRKDTYFSQKVRNLRSHDTLEDLQVATYSSGTWKITATGRRFIEDNQEVIAALEEQGFKKKQIVSTEIEDYSQIIIEDPSCHPHFLKQYLCLR